MYLDRLNLKIFIVMYIKTKIKKTKIFILISNKKLISFLNILNSANLLKQIFLIKYI